MGAVDHDELPQPGPARPDRVWPAGVVVAPRGDAGLAARLAAETGRGAAVRHLDAAAMPTRDALFDAFARALELPAWFGRNFDALFDALRGAAGGGAGGGGAAGGGAGVSVVLDHADDLPAALLGPLVSVLADAGVPAVLVAADVDRVAGVLRDGGHPARRAGPYVIVAGRA